MSPTTELTPAVKVTVLKYLLKDRNNDFITAATGLTHDQVNEVKRDHGYPERDKMQWAIDILEKKADALPQSTTPRTAPVIAPSRPPTRPGTVSVSTRPPATTTNADTIPLVEQLIVRAKASTKASTRKLGERVQTLIEQLRTTVEAEETARRAAEEAAAADAERKAQIARLEAQLAELRGTTPKTKSAKVDGGSDAKVIRAWAAANGVDCPAMGRVPATVREAYEAAQQGSAA